MAIKKKKVTRKQLLKEPDEFLSLSSRLFQFALEHKYHLLAALGGILLVVLTVSGIRYYSQQRAGEAFSLLEKGRLKYQTLLAQGDARKAYLDVQNDFEQIIADYTDKMGGKLARVAYANICYRGGESDKAITLYEQALSDFDDPFYRNIILNGLGYAYEEKRDLQKAAEYFEKITAGSDPVFKGEARYNLGRLYATLGDIEKSRAAYQEVISESPDSIYINLVREKVGQ